MTKPLHFMIVMALSAMALPGWTADSQAPSAASPRVYDFAYQLQPADRSILVQVFDDGKRTFLQLARPEPLPAVFVVTPAGQILLTPKREGQFHVIDRVEKELLVTLGAVRTVVRYAGKTKREDPPALFGPTGPIVLTGSAPAPVPAEQIVAARKPSSAVAPIVQPPPAGLATTAGSAPSPVPKTTAPVTTWVIRTDDRYVSVSLARWAKEAGWAYSWEAPRDFPTNIPASFTEPFEKAVQDVVMAYSTSDSPIKAEFARFGTNKVLRIVKYQGNNRD